MKLWDEFKEEWNSEETRYDYLYMFISGGLAIFAFLLWWWFQ